MSCSKNWTHIPEEFYSDIYICSAQLTSQFFKNVSRILVTKQLTSAIIQRNLTSYKEKTLFAFTTSFFTFQCSLCFRWYSLRMTLARVVIKSALHQLPTEMEHVLHHRKFKIPKGPFNYYKCVLGLRRDIFNKYKM